MNKDMTGKAWYNGSGKKSIMPIWRYDAWLIILS